jgi:hypothetical protein
MRQLSIGARDAKAAQCLKRRRMTLGQPIDDELRRAELGDHVIGQIVVITQQCADPRLGRALDRILDLV